jgi:hypothetical protein
MTVPCRAIGCKKRATGMKGLWCAVHLKQVPGDLKDQIFRAWSCHNLQRQNQLVEEARQAIAAMAGARDAARERSNQ